MEKSSDYYRRKQLINRLQLPLMAEVKEELGENLANVIFSQCPEALKKQMGLDPPLKGPGDTLWTSPSDLLIEKVCLRPPLTDKYIKALTHQGIIEIGRDMDKKYFDCMEREKILALSHQAQYLTKIANRERRIALKHTREEEHNECERRMGTLSSELDAKLKLELGQLETYMMEIQDEKVECAKASAGVEWQLKLNNEVLATTQRLSAEFLKDLESEKQKLIKKFRKELESEQAQFDYAYKQQQEFCRETLKNLKHSLECKNFANLMYVLCMERRKCEIERAALEQKFKLQVEDLVKLIDTQKKDKQKLVEMKNVKQKQIDAREKCLLALIRQFQKFINFALRATPTQAEYLLSVEKLMLFELTQAMIKSKHKKKKTSQLTILPWNSRSSGISKASGLITKDYHKCNNENERSDAAEHEVMPAIFYADNIYAREDFRNKFLNKIEISKSDPIWNKDVENLMKILKNTVHIVDKDQLKNESEKEIISEENNSLGKESGYKESKVYYKSGASSSSERNKLHNISKSALKKSVHRISEEKIKQPIVYCTIPEESGDPTAISVKQLIKELIDIEVTPIETTGILAAKDSLVKVRKGYQGSATFQAENSDPLAETSRKSTEDEESHKSSVTGTMVSFENLDVIRIPDEILLNKCSNRPSKTSVKQWSILHKPLKPDVATQIDSILLHRQSSSKSTESKLLTVKDSLLIHKQSLMLNADKPLATKNLSKHKESKISCHVNSLTLIRRTTQNAEVQSPYEISRPLSKQILIDNAEVKKIIPPLTVSRMEIANIPAYYANAVVNFSPLHEVYETQEIQLDTKDSPWKIYESEAENVPDRDNFLTEVNETTILGDSKMIEEEKSENFTVNRINSILAILREDPSLIRLFTSCTK